MRTEGQKQKPYRVEVRVSIETKMRWHEAVQVAKKEFGWDAETLLKKMLDLFFDYVRRSRRGETEGWLV